MDFDTSSGSGGNRGGRRPPRGGGLPDFSTGTGGRSGRDSAPSRRHGRQDATGEDFRIPAGARKAALVHLALEAWRKDLLDPKELGEVRGRDVDEAGLQRALYRSSMGEIEHVLGPIVKGKRASSRDTSPARAVRP